MFKGIVNPSPSGDGIICEHCYEHCSLNSPLHSKFIDPKVSFLLCQIQILNLNNPHNMSSPHVDSQMTSCNARKLTNCTSLRLFARVGHFMPLQVFW